MILITYIYILQTEPVEYWDDDDSIIDEDFPPDAPTLTEETLCHSQSGQLYADQHAIVWWVVVFTSLFQTLHSLLMRAVQWLLKFLLCLIAVLGKFSPKIFNIAQVFPGTISQRCIYFRNISSVPTIVNMVVCRRCHSIFPFKDCIERKRSI